MLEALHAVGACDLDDQVGQNWYEHRYSYDWFVRENDQEETSYPPMRPRPSGRIAETLEVVAGWKELHDVVAAVASVLERNATNVWYHYSHFYPNGASAYFLFQIERETSQEAISDYHATWAQAMEAVLEKGGGISHHHGIGQVREPWLEQQLGSGTSFLRAIKLALDPKNLINSGALGLL